MKHLCFRNVPWIIALFLGLLLRLGLFSMTQSTGLMITDEQDYQQLALNLLHGYGFGWHPDALTSIRPPLYPAFEALIWTVSATESLVSIRVAQTILSLLNVCLLYRLGLLLFDRHIARLAAVGLWLYPSFIAFNFLLLTEILFTCLLTLVVYSYVLLLQTGRRALAWGAGLALGLAALTRSILWPFPLVLCPLTFLSVSGSWRWRTQLAVSLLLGYVVVVAPWAIRNTRLQGVFTVVDTMGGLNLMMGNYAHTPLNRAWDAVALKGEQSWVYGLPQTPPDGFIWTEGQKEKWAQRQAFTYMLTHPGLTLKRAVVKFVSFWGLERVIIAGWQRGFYTPPWWGVVPASLAITLAYTLTMLCASFGFFLVIPENRKAHLFLVVVMLFMCGVHTIVFGHERYRLPLMPCILLYAAAAWRQQPWRHLRERMPLALAPMAMCLVLLGIWGRELLFIETDRIGTLLRMFSR